MTRKELKLSDTSRGLPENFDLWEELEDQAGEKIRGGAIFSFLNQTPLDIEVILLNGIEIDFILEPGGEILNIPGTNVINVQFDSNPGPIVDPVMEPMASNRRGIFDLEDGMIVFDLG